MNSTILVKLARGIWGHNWPWHTTLKWRKSSPLEKRLWQGKYHHMNMVLEGKIFPTVQTNAKGQLNTITAVDAECWPQTACSEGMLMTPTAVLLLIWLPLKAPLDKHNDELHFSHQTTHVWMIDSSAELGICLFSKNQFFILLYKPMKLLKTHTIYCW